MTFLKHFGWCFTELRTKETNLLIFILTLTFFENLSRDAYLAETTKTIDVLTAHMALAIPKVPKKETFAPNRHQEGIPRSDVLEDKLPIIFCTEF